MKFTKTLRRFKTTECPLMRGATGLVFEESEEGQSFSDLISEILDAGESIAKQSEKERILNLVYPMNITVNHTMEEEDLKDIRFGLSILDRASTEYRLSIATTEMDAAKAQALKIWINFNVVGALDLTTLALEGDSANVDLSGLSASEVESSIVPLMAWAQRQGPKTYIISEDFEKTLSTSDTTMAKRFKMFSEQNKNVFSVNPVNETVRTF